MRPHFETMMPFGKPLKKGTLKRTNKNLEAVQAAEAELARAEEAVKNAGLPEEKINARGQMTVWQRLSHLVDEGSWTPLHTPCTTRQTTWKGPPTWWTA